MKLFKGLSCTTNFDCFSLASCYGHSVSVLMMWRQSWDGIEVDHTAESVNRKCGTPLKVWIESRRNVFQSLHSTTPCPSPCTRAIISPYYGPERKQWSWKLQPSSQCNSEFNSNPALFLTHLEFEQEGVRRFGKSFAFFPQWVTAPVKTDISPLSPELGSA